MIHPALIERITRSLAYMLRHKPDEFDLEVDRHGFADLAEVVQALNERSGEPIEEADVEEAIEAGDRPRYEIREGRIRALYGHSISVDPGQPTKPPEVLYVGVGSKDAERVQRYGLHGGRRRFLHLALTEAEAIDMGRRLGEEYAVITVHALDAWEEEEVNFYDRRSVFLSDPIPKEFLSVGDMRSDGEPRLDRFERSERSDRGDRADRGDRQDRPERLEGSGRPPSRGWVGSPPAGSGAGEDSSGQERGRGRRGGRRRGRGGRSEEGVTHERPERVTGGRPSSVERAPAPRREEPRYERDRAPRADVVERPQSPAPPVPPPARSAHPEAPSFGLGVFEEERRRAAGSAPPPRRPAAPRDEAGEVARPVPPAESGSSTPFGAGL